MESIHGSDQPLLTIPNTRKTFCGRELPVKDISEDRGKVTCKNCMRVIHKMDFHKLKQDKLSGKKPATKIRPRK